MERISLTYFVDFVLKAGAPKLTGVRDFKENKDEAYTDFYKQVREAIVDMHKKGASDKVLDPFLHAQTDERRRRIYPSIIEGYRKFLASGRISWFAPPVGTYAVGGVEINVNPELGLNIDGTPHLIKMYFRGEPLASKRVSVVLNLMTSTGIRSVELTDARDVRIENPELQDELSKALAAVPEVTLTAVLR